MSAEEGRASQTVAAFHLEVPVSSLEFSANKNVVTTVVNYALAAKLRNVVRLIHVTVATARAADAVKSITAVVVVPLEVVAHSRRRKQSLDRVLSCLHCPVLRVRVFKGAA
eukprot:gene29047-38095_t